MKNMINPIKYNMIKLYYNTRIKIHEMPEYEDLSKEEIEYIGKTLGFAIWWLNYEVEKAFKKRIIGLKLKLYFSLKKVICRKKNQF